MLTSPNSEAGYRFERDNHGILVFHFEQVTVETVTAWRDVQMSCLTREPSTQCPGLLMMIDTNGHDTIPFQQITQHAAEFAREQQVLMPVRHAWVTPITPLTQAARPMLRLLPDSFDVDVRFFAPTRRQLAYAWLMAEHARLLSQVL